ncbi:DMT family transporter [Planktotalea sp.]|uniref:DMT family transporter n=1 Tax=Planktotalea sp. TaxID=2029877 RepID=UPI0025D95B06|nr:DMT family transporter [Planktotalea sp.]
MSPFTGIALKLASVVLFVIMSALIKATTDDVPTGQAMFFRSFFALPIIIGWLVWSGDLKTGLHTSHPMGHVWRGLIGVCGMGFGFSSLAYLPLPDVTAIGFAGPLMTVVLAAILLGERLRIYRISAVLLGLVGVFVILSPRLSIFSGEEMERTAQIGVALVLASAMFRALVQIHIRRLAQTEKTAAIVFYFSMTTTLLSLLTLPFGWTMPDTSAVIMLVCAGLIGGAAQIFITSAFCFAGAAVIAPFDYAAILFSMIIGYFVFSDVPTPQMLIGSGIVILSGLLIIWREHALELKRGKARPTLTPQG